MIATVVRIEIKNKYSMSSDKKRGRKRTNYYFTDVHEQAIVDYCNTDDKKIKTELYIHYIQPAFGEMVDKMIYTYRFNNLANIDCLRDECKMWLMTILDKFDPNKGTKAFSYFSVITRNWFIHKFKINSKKNKRECSYEESTDELETQLESFNLEDSVVKKEYFQFLHEEFDEWLELELTEEERKVIEAIKILFEKIDEIEIFNKKAVYLYLKELTNIDSKGIVVNLNKIRKRYRDYKQRWNNGEI